MKPTNDFDCVQMKWDIQQRLLAEEQELGAEEARRLQDERARANPVIGAFLQRLKGGENHQERSQEMPEYVKPAKDFDCVQMKWDIQQRLLEEEQELGPEEARRRRQERLREDPILGPFLRRMEERRRKKAGAALEQLIGKI